MGCSGSKGGEEVVDYKNVLPFNSNYPPPKPSRLLRSQIYTPEDNEAAQQKLSTLPKGAEGKYTTLLKHLCTGQSDVRKVRAIYLWLATQNFNSPALTYEKPADTPRGYQKMIKEGSGTLPTYFTILCRRSGVHCAIIPGLGKDNTYQFGTEENKMKSQWNAVYVEGEWRLIHVEWGLGHSGNYGNNNNKGELNDHFFLTDPEEFAVTCLPEDYRWQLLQEPFTKREFLTLPIIKPAFFDMDMYIIKPKSGTNKVTNGTTTVEISAHKDIMASILMKYNLEIKEKYHETEPRRDYDEDDGEPPTSDLKRYVFMNRKPSKFVLDLVFPVPGQYVFDLQGDILDDNNGATQLCQFRFLSEKKPSRENLEPLPDSPEIGWGPGPVCKRLGLIPLTHHDGCIYIKPGGIREIRFKMIGDLDVMATLANADFRSDEMDDIIKYDVVGDVLRIIARVPEEGLFALKILVKEDGGQDFQEACNYLLKQHLRGKYSETYATGNTGRKYRDRMLRSRLEKHISDHTSEKELRYALSEFECYRVPDKGEKKRAEEKLAQYWLIKNELEAGCLRRHPGNLRKWIDKARKSKYEADLQEEIRQAERTEENVKRLKGYLHPIARMDEHTFLEIRTYHRPPPVVRDVMGATYVLLGEDRRDVEDWEYVQYLMTQTGKDSLQARILDRRLEDVPQKNLHQAERMLKPHDLQAAREASTGTAAFYRWANQFIRTGRQKDMSAAEREEDDSHYKDRETFREPYTDRTSLDSRWDTARKPATANQNRDERRTAVESPKQNGHPFGVEEYEGPKSPRKIFMTPSKPSDNHVEKPYSYAGFKE